MFTDSEFFAESVKIKSLAIFASLRFKKLKSEEPEILTLIIQENVNDNNKILW